MPSSLARRLALGTESVSLVLQGGGALGAYQAGAFEELVEGGVDLAWVAGVSIGAINAALIAGNAPERRVDALRAFWELVSSGPARVAPLFDGQRGAFNQWSAAVATTVGVPGMYRAQVLPAMFQPDGAPGALGVYDTSELRATLERLVDFDRINARDGTREKIRFSVGAVDVETGNSTWFDNHDPTIRIGPEHVMASGALPPAFPPVVIDGASYWDGGVLSNTPLQYVLDERPERRMLVVQVDLFPARGPLPVNLDGVLTRHKDILYSSRSRYSSDKVAERERLKGAVRRLIARLPAELRDDPDLRALRDAVRVEPVDIVHLIYRQSAFEQSSKDYEFSRPSMREHWDAGRRDMRTTRERLDELEASDVGDDVTVYDLARGSGDAPSHAGPTVEQRERVAVERAGRALAARRAKPKSKSKPKPRRAAASSTTKKD